MKVESLRAIAFYLPQFHPIPENDEWWGKGFTEWSNVTRAQPLFPGHYQPHLPADLGFYDLRLPEARKEQADLAREYGIHGFCYYHYWFNARRLLERPIHDILSSGEPDFPFCLCWANENWTRRWDGQEQEILIQQVYSAEDDLQHIRSLLPAFNDRRYITVDGKPLFLIYRISNLPEPAETIRRWQEEVRKAGLPGLYLVNVESLPAEHGVATTLPVDAAVEFAPDWNCLGKEITPGGWPGFFSRMRSAPSSHKIHSYSSLSETMKEKPTPDYLRYPCVTPMWDNSSRRREGATILAGSTPVLYERWLKKTVKEFVPPSLDENFIFINAWNEWAEGNHLEPCQKWGRQYLEATRNALAAFNGIT